MGDRQQKQTHKNRPRNGACLTHAPHCHGDRPSWPAQPGALKAQEAGGAWPAQGHPASGSVRKPSRPPRRRSEALPDSPTPGLKNLQPHLRPIVLAENLGQGHSGREGIISASAPLNISRLQPRQVTREPAGPPRPGAGPAPAGEVDGWAAAGVVGCRAPAGGQQLP